MKKISKQGFLRQSLLVSGALLASSGLALADDAAKVVYKDGTVISNQDFNLKVNFLIQPNFSYNDYDSEGRRDLGVDPIDDSTSFDVRRTRMLFGGDLLQKQFSYLIYTDLRASDGSNELQDAWVQWNSDAVHVKWGQFNLPFSRQNYEYDHGFQMVDRSLTSTEFSVPREMGVLAHGPVADNVFYAVGAYNGVESQNQAGQDNKLLYTAALTASSAGYGDRGFEGDLRQNNGSFESTGGVAAYYLEGDTDDHGNVNQFALNVDGGLKCNGLSAQGEVYYRNNDFDDNSDSTDDFGFYLQAGYMLDRQWELAGRFGYIDLDDVGGVDTDTEEYSAVVNYYLNGHNLKIQTGLNFVVDNVEDDDISDFQFITQLTGWI